MSYGFIIDNEELDAYSKKLCNMCGEDVLGDALEYKVYSRPYYSHDAEGNPTKHWTDWCNTGSYSVVGDVVGFMRFNGLNYDANSRCQWKGYVWYDSVYLAMLLRFTEALRVSVCEVTGYTVTGRYIWRYPYCNLPEYVRGLLGGRGRLCVCDVVGFEMSVLCEMFGIERVRFEDYGEDRDEGKENFYRYIYAGGGTGYGYVYDDGKVWAKGKRWDKEVLDRLDREVGSKIEGVEDIHSKVQGRCSELFNKLLGYLGGYGGFRIAYHLHDEIVIDSDWSVYGVFSDVFRRLEIDTGIRLEFKYDERDRYGSLIC